MAASKHRKKLGGRALTRLVTTLVFLVSSAILVLTVWFFASTLAEVDQTTRGDNGRTASLDGINGELLDELLKFHEARRSDPPTDPSRHGNPFVPLPPRAETAPPVTAPVEPVVPPADQPPEGEQPPEGAGTQPQPVP